ncbi:hypothetical protein MRB53_004414 [Persea americana]|uniref:Uncharacterized protein n=1 Tax=Persea americana TaxID=3435 RepID=A0ACC2MBC0_PERAE|nr:hypothetical protein MRB53_004414 [Persea americana]
MIMENNLLSTHDRRFPFRYRDGLDDGHCYSLTSFLSILLVMTLAELKLQQLDRKKLDTSLSPSQQAASESGRRMRSDTLTEAVACAWEILSGKGKGMPDQCLSLPPKMKNGKEREEQKLSTLSSIIFPDLLLYEYLMKCWRSQRLRDAPQSRAENNTGMKAVAEPRFSWWWGE